MFQTLKFEVQFKNPRKGHSGNFKDSHTFKKGMTLIYGANEKGKSLRAEYLRFALWGRKALRGKVSDYKKLVVDVEFQLKGVDYRIHRTKSDATIYQGGTPMATGTSPVNDKIETLFGYDMEVFDLANAVLQGEVEALGKMQPARRKALVDNLIGLGVIDSTIKDLVETRKASKVALATLESNLIEPEKPSVSLTLTEDEIVDFPKVKQDYIRGLAIDNELLGLGVSQPEKPEPSYDWGLAEMFSEYHQLMLAHDVAVKYLNRMPDVDDTGMTLDEIREAYTQALSYEACENVECPECEHTFNPSGFEQPKLSSKQCVALREQQQQFNQWVEANEAAVKAEVTLNDYLDGASAEAIVAAKKGADTYKQALIVYDMALKANEVSEKRRQKLEQEHINLIKYSGDFREYEKKYNETLTAAQLIRQYDTYKKAYDTQLEKVETLRAEVENYDTAIVGLRNLKTSIKSYLVPSLNKVASAYLSQMTDGSRSSVVISENFDIVVDGQPMEALSGSAKAVANLAIRLALGQTLTNSVFSVLMADEIDAAMDKERADYTAKCLRKLTGKIKQIIIISHKKLEADNYVELT